jgi:hypothetical protein
MDNLQGPVKRKNSCGKTVHRGTMDRGFTVYKHSKVHYKVYFKLILMYSYNATAWSLI